MTSDADICPHCGENLEFDEVDIGVGTLRGNPGCPNCHWTPDTKHDPTDAQDKTDELL